ncbi:MAG: ABC transporter ATP-binding protein [Ruminococcaceae bacterium]|nr:ABC transporter ATP-binding protein [Oscillospiraceae bacterium]
MKSLSSLKWIYSNSKKTLPYLILLTVISAFMSLCLVALTYLGKQIVDIATGAYHGAFWDKIILLAFFIILELILQVVYSRLNIKLSGKMEMSIKTSVFNRLLKKDISDIYKYHTGELLNRLTGDVVVVTTAFTSIVPVVVSLITKLIGAFSMLFWLDPSFALIYLIFGPVFILVTQIYSRKMKSLHKKCQESDGKVKSYIQEALSNILVIKAFKNEEAIANETYNLQKINFNFKIKRNTISIIANILVYIAFTFGYYLALGWGAYKLSFGYITVGTLTAMLQLVSQVQTPFRGISSIIPQFYHAIASTERIIEIENLKEDMEGYDDQYLSDIYSDMKSIVFSDVSFKYDDRNVVVNNFSYTILKGDFIAIRGISGIGKSTLLKLLLGVIKPDSGEIYIELNNNKKIKIDEKTRGLFSYVPQGNMILSGSIRDNIKFFKKDVSDDLIFEACKIARIYDFIKELPDGLSTIIGEKGVGLSEGQIQRVAIARALICDSPLLLLDESTSALDEQTEKEFLESIKNIKTRTCLIVSHKQAAFDICDKTIEF